jgi:glycosyltransferase involved in cell wall biosynthesis
VTVGGEPRLALVTVNFSTTRYLKLMLLTLADQADLGLVHRIVVVDNGSRDGGPVFLARLAAAVPRLVLVQRRRRLSHGAGMRAGLRALERAERSQQRRSNVVVFCDTDVIFRDRDALGAIAGLFLAHDAALVGEVRTGVNPEPDIQASLFAVRRDVLARRDVAPPVDDGSPAYRLQRAVWDAGLPVVDLPTNRSGLTLHRGRAGVEAARRFRPWHSYASVPTNTAHYMGVPDGAAIWATVEAGHRELLEPTAEAGLIAHLSARFEALGTATVTEG